MDTISHEQRIAANRARMRPAPAPPLPPLVDDGSLRLAVCPRCEYDLNGSPPAGTCPECGRAYDDTVVYLYGSSGEQGPPTTVRMWTKLVGWAGLLCVVLIVITRLRYWY